MPNTEKDLKQKTLAEQLEALATENANPTDSLVESSAQTSAESSMDDSSLINEAGDIEAGVVDMTVLGEVSFETEEETSLERISEITAALARLAAEGKLEEAHLNFIDGPADVFLSESVDDSTAMDLILKSLPSSHGDANEQSHGDANEQSHGDANEQSHGDANELPENSMRVGEPEQLPMLGMNEAAEEIEEEVLPDEPTEFVDNDKLVSVIESLLFATDKPVSIATMKVLFKGTNIRTRDIQRTLDGLASSFAAADRGVSLEEIHGGYQLRTKVDNTDFLKRLAKARPFRLSGPALEVLAIAAYKQPVTKHEVDQIRGVESGHLMRALMERGMVGFGEKSDLPGRPMTYVTTRKFLETFGLRNLKELPTLAEIDQLLPEGIGPEEEKETLSSVTDSMANSIGSTYSESQDELDDISESLKVIDTTSEFFEQEKIRQRVERDEQRAQDIRDKIAFGDEVEDKDRRWLMRFETKQEQMAQAAQAGEATGPLIVEEEGEAPFVASVKAGTNENESVSIELAALSDSSVLPEGDAEEVDDELAMNSDYEEEDSADFSADSSADSREDVDGDV